MVEIRRLSAEEARRHRADLAGILLDCVHGGASVSFMASLTRAEAEAFFAGVIEGVERGDRMLLAAFVDFTLVGTIQIIMAMPPNQPHRAEVAKLLVSRSARGSGVGSRLVEEAEKQSLLAGKTLLVLDTVTGGQAEKIYTRLGWNRVGVISNYALFPDGAWCDTTIFCKQLDGLR